MRERLPPDAVALVRAALARRAVVAGGFVSLGESPHKTWWFQSLHNGAPLLMLAMPCLRARARAR